jgi:hypothetical protein
MKKIYTMSICCLLYAAANAQVARDLATELTVTYDKAKPSITLQWVPDSSATSSYLVYKKTKQATKWGNKIATIAINKYTYTDTNVEVGKGYEYYVRKTKGSYYGGGYIYAGIEMPVVENRGRIIFVLDTTHKSALSAELLQQKMDMIGDGWRVHTVEVSPTTSVPNVKQQIIDIYEKYPSEVNALYLFGNVPVPYSGRLNPDGHGDHIGAWPCDGFYGDVLDYTDNWSDVSVSDVSASRLENRNSPFDGKYDQSVFPTDVELEVGRTDLSKMPAFAPSETELLRSYINKAHQFRHRKYVAEMQGIIDDNFGFMGGEAFAANAWRNFSPLLGENNYTADDYFGAMRQKTYIWSYGTGGGWYQGAGGVGNTDSFAVDTTRGVFSNLFGSYFGDWDVQNSFLRAPLASPKSSCLTNAWVGRPWWQFHHMAMGENIGYCARLIMNNGETYFNAQNFALSYVHIALMGDPTLRMHTIVPPSNVTVNKSHGGAFVDLSWTASTDQILGYHIYRADSLDGKFVRINANLITSHSYTDNRPVKGTNIYMVRAVKFETTPSGSYFNLSQAAFTSLVQVDTVDYQGVQSNLTYSLKLYPNPATSEVNILINPEAQAGKLYMYDVTGKCVYTQTVVAGTSIIAAALPPLAAGCYHLRWEGNLTANGKLIIQ